MWFLFNSSASIADDDDDVCMHACCRLNTMQLRASASQRSLELDSRPPILANSRPRPPSQTHTRRPNAQRLQRDGRLTGYTAARVGAGVGSSSSSGPAVTRSAVEFGTMAMAMGVDSTGQGRRARGGAGCCGACEAVGANCHCRKARRGRAFGAQPGACVHVDTAWAAISTCLLGYRREEPTGPHTRRAFSLRPCAFQSHAPQTRQCTTA